MLLPDDLEDILIKFIIVALGLCFVGLGVIVMVGLMVY